MNFADLNEKMESLANKLADKLLGDSAPDEGVVDAFKALTGYYSNSRKVGKSQDIEGGITNGGLGAAKRRIHDIGRHIEAEGSNGTAAPDPGTGS